MKTYWMGKDIDTLPRDKLVEIIRQLYGLMEANRIATQSMIEINKLTRERLRAVT